MTPDVIQVKATRDYFIEAEFATGELRRGRMRRPSDAELNELVLFS